MVLLFTAGTVSAQWTSRASFPGTPRAKAATFTIGNKIYLMGGVDNNSNILKDFWEYDIPGNAWVQKPDFPGAERYGAATFVLNNSGYIATGGNDFGYLDDLWQYIPASQMWVQRPGLPVTIPQHENQRTEAFAFVAGNKAYLGGGEGWVFGPNSTTNIAFNDLWEYDPNAATSWTQKSGFPDFIGRNMAVAVALNNKGYIGLGCNVGQTVNHQGFWEYDPATDTWLARAAFPNLFTADAGAFVLDSAVYVLGGVNMNPVSLSGQLYKYDVSSNTWTAQSNFSGNAIAGQITVSTGTSAFAGTGYNSSIACRTDFWEFNLATGISGVKRDDYVIKLYPNPAQEFLIIESEKDILSVEITDVSGRNVSPDVQDVNKIQVSEFPSGIYTIRLNFGNNEMAFRKFVVSH